MVRSVLDGGNAFPPDPLAREQLIRRFTRRGGAAAGLAAERAGLIDRRFEVLIPIAKRDPLLANRHAAIRLAFDAAMDRDQLIGGAST